MMKTAKNIKLLKHLSGVVIAIAALFCTPALMAQDVSGSVTGAVTDSSGAVIPGAHVTAENVGTSVKTESTTNDSGVFTIRFLPIGTYRVTVEAAGFGSQSIPSFALEVNQTVKINASLKVGSSNTSVEVQGELAPILNTTDATLANTFTANELANLPLNGGNFSEVTIFQPGAVATSPQGFTGNNAIERETFNSGTPSINGNRGQANNYTLEGADNNEPQNNLIAYNPAVEALGEVRVITSNAPATYGNANGGAVVAILKSGTNQFHGSAFMYLEDDKLDANTWANKFTSPITPRNPYTQTQFGGTLGGPIWRDKKLFFFGDYKGVRRHSGGIASTNVIPAAFRNGDFSALYANGGVQLYDTQNNFAPYKNNQIPAIINPVAKYLFAHPDLYPLPNAVPTDGLMQNNFQGPTKSFVVNNQFDAKIEWDPGTTNKFTAFYSAGRAFDETSALIQVNFPSQNVYPSKLSGGSWIHTFSPAIVNDARFGFTRVRWDNSIPTDPSGDFGLKGNSIVGIPFGTQSYVGFSQQNFQSGQVGTQANTQILRDNTFNYYDNLTWQHGQHLFSMGVQATRYQQNYLNASNFGFLGSFTYGNINGATSTFTQKPGVSPGYAVADFVLDRVSQTALGSTLGIIGNRQWRTAGYFQDDWKVTPNLTFNLGVRYEFDQPWYEAHNKTANVVLINGAAQLEYAGSIPVGAPSGSSLCPTKACYNANWTQIMPRFGFAYQAAPRLVIRGGYGATSFFEGDAFNQRLTSSPPFAVGSNPQATAPLGTSGGKPFKVEDGLSQQFNDVTNSTYSVWPQNQKPAYINEFNLTTEFALSNTLSLSASYLGETGHHLADYGNPNEWTLAQANAVATANIGNTSGTQIIPASAVTPYSNLAGVSTNSGVLITESRAMMNYNGLLASLRQRTHHGLEYTINYTYAKAMTDSPGNYGSSPGTSGANGAYQDYFNSAADYGPSSNDIRHNLTAIATYALPFGRGQIYGAGMNRALDEIVGGWKISGTLLNYTGFPITINGPNPTGINSDGGGRANQYRHFKIVNRSVSNWWGTDPSVNHPVTDPVTHMVVNTCASIASDDGVCAYGPASSQNFPAVPLAFGDAAVNSERAPGYRQFDSSLFKDFHIYGEHVIGFRANFYNLFNIASYGNPSNNITNTNFGQITSVNSPPRQIELSAHYNF
jgi:hypothetical protein